MAEKGFKVNKNIEEDKDIKTTQDKGSVLKRLVMPYCQIKPGQQFRIKDKPKDLWQKFRDGSIDFETTTQVKFYEHVMCLLEEA